MSCAGTGDCQQGRVRCRTPLTCSGVDVDEAIEAFRRECPPRPLPAKPWPPRLDDHDEDVGLPIVIAVLVACIGVSALICAAVGLRAAGQYLGLF